MSAMRDDVRGLRDDDGSRVASVRPVAVQAHADARIGTGVGDLMHDSLDFPHGMPEGFRLGCHAMACIGKDRSGLTCLDAFTRYSGDFGFRRLVDSGASATDLAEYVRAEHELLAAASKRRSKPPPRPKRARRPARRVQVQKPASNRSRSWQEGELERLRILADADAPIVEIARQTGHPESSCSRKRKELGYPPKYAPKTHGTRGGYERGCRGDDCPATPSCELVARAYWRERSERRRRADGIQPRKWRT